MAVEHINADASTREKATVIGTEKKDLAPVELENADKDANSFHNPSFDEDVEPELHARTYIALAAMILLNYVQVLALQGPPAVV